MDFDSVARNEIKIGEVYPVYGAISDLVDYGTCVCATIQPGVRCQMVFTGREQVDLIRSRMFDPGIFVCEIVDIDEYFNVFAKCQTVVFGKRSIEQ
jgi:hypothetical protein